MTTLPPSLQHLQLIRDNQRSTTWQGEYKGKPVFIKQHKPAPHITVEEIVRRELWGLQAFDTLSRAVDLGFAVPRIITHGTDYLVTTFAVGRPMALDPGQPSYHEQLRFFAASLAAIDRATELAHRVPAAFDVRFRDPHRSITRLQQRFQDINYASTFPQPLIDAAFTYVHDHIDELEARLTHADFTPDNILQEGSRRTLIDFESAGLVWPRFYDLVNLTCNRIALNPALAEGCRQIIQMYVARNKEAEPGRRLTQLNTCAMLRTLSLIWETHSQPNWLHNTERAAPEVMMRIQKLLDGMLHGSLYWTIDL